LSYSDGGVYKGNFLKGDQYGYGRFDLENGDYYEGNWEKNLFSGFGTYYYKMENLEY